MPLRSLLGRGSGQDAVVSRISSPGLPSHALSFWPASTARASASPVSNRRTVPLDIFRSAAMA
jgi:hypothetical protein